MGLVCVVRRCKKRKRTNLGQMKSNTKIGEKLLKLVNVICKVGEIGEKYF